MVLALHLLFSFNSAHATLLDVSFFLEFGVFRHQHEAGFLQKNVLNINSLLLALCNSIDSMAVDLQQNKPVVHLHLPLPSLSDRGSTLFSQYSLLT